MALIGWSSRVYSNPEELMKRKMWFASLLVAAALSFSAAAVRADWCATAERFDGHCDVCNAFCFLEWLFDVT